MNTKLAGIVGKSETRYTPEGKAVLTFSLGQYTGGNKDAGYKDRAWVKVEEVW
jgi:primosomal replication protein N